MDGRPLDERSAFRYGFLKGCAEEGLNAKQAMDRAALLLRHKRAGFMDAASKTLGGLQTAGLAGLAVPLLGAATVGAGTGAALAKINDPPVDPEAARDQELIAAYDHYAQQARLRERMMRLRKQPRPGRF